MMTAMVGAQELTFDTGHRFTILTCDQQLYRVVLWAHPDRFKDMYLRLGGMHALMSFVGAIGTLMAKSGLSDILTEVFGGVQKMLSGKKFPHYGCLQKRFCGALSLVVSSRQRMI